MMRSKSLTLFATALFALLASGVQAETMEEWAEKYGIRTDASYEATRVMETEAGQFQFKERKAPGKSAMGMDMGGMQGTAIIREDLEKAWFIMPDMGYYREMDISQAAKQQADSMQVSRVEELGREEVNGFPSRKFKSHFKYEGGKAEGFMWITDDGIPIKMDMVYTSRRMKGQQMKMELVDLQVRAQDATHFELPEGLQPLTLGAMMRAAAQGNTKNSGTSQAAPASEQSGAGQPGEQATVIEEVIDVAADETENSVKNETRSAIRRGIRGLFNR